MRNISDFWDNPFYVELKPGWWTFKLPGEKFIGGLPKNPHAPAVPYIIYAAIISYSAYSQYQQGQQAKDLAEQRAEIEKQNALNAQKIAAEKARLEEEEGRKLIAKQSMIASASGIRSNVGSPLLIKAETIRDIAIEKENILKYEGEDVARNYRLRAAYERAYGRAQARTGTWNAVSSIMEGIGYAGMGAYKAGWFGGGNTGSGTTDLMGMGKIGSPYTSQTSGVNSLMGWKP
jgi:hypothetical protein